MELTSSKPDPNLLLHLSRHPGLGKRLMDRALQGGFLSIEIDLGDGVSRHKMLILLCKAIDRFHREPEEGDEEDD